MRTAVQLYTLRSVDASTPELIELVASTPLDGVEFAGIGEADPVTVREVLDTTGLGVPGAHVGFSELVDEADTIVHAYRTMGCESMVVPYLEEACFTDPQTLDQTARRLSNLATELGEMGLRLHYHNHDHEFVPIEGTTAYELLIERAAARVCFELDIGWATVAGQDPVDLIDRFGDRIRLLHVKDVDVPTREQVDLGDGDVDIAACVRAASDADVEWLIFEHDDPPNPRESLRRSSHRLTAIVEEAR